MDTYDENENDMVEQPIEYLSSNTISNTATTKEIKKDEKETTETDIEKYIEFIGRDLTSVTLKEKLDFACSISVFEHIRDAEGNIKKLSYLIRKGGFMYHKIDMRDHYNFNNPFLFYKYSYIDK